MRWHLTVPASVANLGPGFDILALAIDLANEVTFEDRGDGTITASVVEGANVELDGHENLLVRSYRSACLELDSANIPGVHFSCVNRIPLGSGLGSSAAAIVSGILAAHVLNTKTRTGTSEKERRPVVEQSAEVAPSARVEASGVRQARGGRANHTSNSEGGVQLDTTAILKCAARLEGHPDNVAAALLGGLVICSPLAAVERLDISENLRCVIHIPTQPSSTPKSRAAIPTSFSREDAVFNAGRIALLVRALACRDYAGLSVAMQDRWHQPYRNRIFPALSRVIDAALGAGAYGACLAGAGPSMVALCCRNREEDVTLAMSMAAETAGVEGDIIQTCVRNHGAAVTRLS